MAVGRPAGRRRKGAWNNWSAVSSVQTVVDPAGGWV
jgi:hypothetical protein